MTTAPCPPTPADPAPNEPSTARTENCTCCDGARQPDPTDLFVGMLTRLAEIGMARVERIERRAEAEENAARDINAAAEAKADLILQRNARMTRLCMALALKFKNERIEREKKTAADHAVAEKKRRERRKSLIERVVTQEIEREAAERGEAEGLDTDAILDGLDYDVSERLDEEDIERDLDRCPPGELIARVCREYGIELDREFWRQHQWALEEAGLKSPGSPYATEPEPEPLEPEPAEAKPPEPEVLKPPEVKSPDPAAPLPLELDPRFDPRRAPTPETKRWMEAHLKHLRGGR